MREFTKAIAELDRSIPGKYKPKNMISETAY
jgi:hypothetical protein